MNLLNLKVKHKRFGEGLVTEVNSKYLIVKFASRTSRFLYPDAFDEHLLAEDEAVQSIIRDEIKKKKAKEEQQKATDLALKLEEEHLVTKKQVSTAKKKRRSLEDGFGPDYNVKYLKRQPILSYQQVEKQFGIKIYGFGHGINIIESALVLISTIDKKKGGFVYHDHWDTNGDYIYSGEGKRGDQIMKKGNKAIVDAESEKKPLHLFVKFSPQEYYYQGVFTMVDYTYEDDKDQDGNMRKEYKFRLRRQSVE